MAGQDLNGELVGELASAPVFVQDLGTSINTNRKREVVGVAQKRHVDNHASLDVDNGDFDREAWDGELLVNPRLDSSNFVVDSELGVRYVQLQRRRLRAWQQIRLQTHMVKAQQVHETLDIDTVVSNIRAGAEGGEVMADHPTQAGARSSEGGGGGGGTTGIPVLHQRHYHLAVLIGTPIVGAIERAAREGGGARVTDVIARGRVDHGSAGPPLSGARGVANARRFVGANVAVATVQEAQHSGRSQEEEE